jgi:hypothetical protein
MSFVLNQIVQTLSMENHRYVIFMDILFLFPTLYFPMNRMFKEPAPCSTTTRDETAHRLDRPLPNGTDLRPYKIAFAAQSATARETSRCADLLSNNRACSFFYRLIRWLSPARSRSESVPLLGGVSGAIVVVGPNSTTVESSSPSSPLTATPPVEVVTYSPGCLWLLPVGGSGRPRKTPRPAFSPAPLAPAPAMIVLRSAVAPWTVVVVVVVVVVVAREVEVVVGPAAPRSIISSSSRS